MNDYSEVTCHLHRDVVNLINALNDKKWDVATTIAWALRSDAEKVGIFASWEYKKLKANNNESK